jgi:hypothetical protein
MCIMLVLELVRMSHSTCLCGCTYVKQDFNNYPDFKQPKKSQLDEFWFTPVCKAKTITIASLLCQIFSSNRFSEILRINFDTLFLWVYIGTYILYNVILEFCITKISLFSWLN